MTTNDLKQLSKLLDQKLQNFPTKEYLDKKLEDFATKEYLDKKLEDFATKEYLKSEIESVKQDLEQTIRLTNSKLREDFKFAINESFRKYMDKILKGQDKMMDEIETVRQEQTAGQAHDEHVDERLDRLEKHTGLPPLM